MGDFVHVSLEREDALRRTETSECAVRRNVCSNRAAVNSDVGTEVWTSSVNRSARKHDGRECAISATVDGEVDLHREEFAVFRNRRFMTRVRWMTLGGGHHVFSAIIDDLYGLA